MAKVKNMIREIIKTKPAGQNAQPVCNYADNYYGDRVCTLPVKS
jgi:hypothetical protein